MATKTVWLQFVGDVASKAAGEFTVGEWMRWNGGTSSQIVAIREASPAFLIVTFTGERGEKHDRKIKKTRQCAIGAAPRYAPGALAARADAFAAKLAAARDSEKK